MPRFHIPAEDAQGPLVVGIDIGSGGTRAAVYDVTGREVGSLHHKETHSFTVGADGTSTIDADQVVEEIRTALAAVLTATELPGEVRAIGFDTFASSLVAVDAAGKALTPCITYADTRCHDQVAASRRAWTWTRSTSAPAPACTPPTPRPAWPGCGRRSRTSSPVRSGSWPSASTWP